MQRPTRSAWQVQRQWAAVPVAPARRAPLYPAARPLPRWRLCLAVAMLAAPVVLPLLAAL